MLNPSEGLLDHDRSPLLVEHVGAGFPTVHVLVPRTWYLSRVCMFRWPKLKRFLGFRVGQTYLGYLSPMYVSYTGLVNAEWY